jgi:hypothetical protein
MKPGKHRFYTIILILLVWSSCTCGQTRAQISDAELAQRLAFITTRLAALNPNATYWQYGWTGFYTASTAAQALLAVDEDDDNDEETNYIVGAVKSAGALTQMLIKPLPAVRSFERFDAMPAETRTEQLRKLERGEALLQENADRAMGRYEWKRHLIGIGANLLGGAVIAAFGDSSDALTSTLVGIAVSEANIWTEPSRAIKDLEAYRNEVWTQPRVKAGKWHLVPIQGGAAVQINF